MGDRGDGGDRPPRVPLRTCAGCRRRRPKGELLRIALGGEGTVILDVPARAPGRGAYVCRDTALECLRAARRRHGLSRTLRVGENVIDHEGLADDAGALISQASPGGVPSGIGPQEEPPSRPR